MVAEYYENTTDGHKKFWKITYNKDFSITVNWGRIGATGSTKTFPFSSKSEQKQFQHRLTFFSRAHFDLVCRDNLYIFFHSHIGKDHFY